MLNIKSDHQIKHSNSNKIHKSNKNNQNDQRRSIQPFSYDEAFQRHIGKRSGRYIGQINTDQYYDGYARFSDIITLNSIAINKISESSCQNQNKTDDEIEKKVNSNKIESQGLPDFGFISSIKKKRMSSSSSNSRTPDKISIVKQIFIDTIGINKMNEEIYQQSKSHAIKRNEQIKESIIAIQQQGLQQFQFISNQKDKSLMSNESQSQKESTLQVLMKLKKKFQDEENNRDIKVINKLEANVKGSNKVENKYKQQQHRKSNCAQQANKSIGQQIKQKKGDKMIQQHQYQQQFKQKNKQLLKQSKIINKRNSFKDPNNINKRRHSVRIIEKPVQIITYIDNDQILNELQEEGVEILYKKRLSQQYKQMMRCQQLRKKLSVQKQSEIIKVSKLQQKKMIVDQINLKNLMNNDANEKNQKKQTRKMQTQPSENNLQNQKKINPQKKTKKIKSNIIQHQSKQTLPISLNMQQQQQNSLNQKKKNKKTKKTQKPKPNQQQKIQIIEQKQQNKNQQQKRYPKRNRIKPLLYWCQKRQKKHGQYVGVFTFFENKYKKDQNSNKDGLLKQKSISIEYQKQKQKEKQKNIQIDIYEQLGIMKSDDIKFQEIKKIQQENPQKVYKIYLKSKQKIIAKNGKYKHIKLNCYQGDIKIFFSQKNKGQKLQQQVNLYMGEKFTLKNNSYLKKAVLLVNVVSLQNNQDEKKQKLK